MQPTENALVVLEKRYFLPGENWDGLCKRVAKAVANGDVELESKYFEAINNFYFLPNSPALMNAGTSIGNLSACFVLDLSDSMESIMDTAKDMSIVFKCISGNQKILTTNGIKNARDISVHDIMFDSSGKENEVIDVIDSGTKKIYRITTDSGYSIDCSINHKVKSINENVDNRGRARKNIEAKYIEVSNLRIGDYVNIACPSYAGSYQKHGFTQQISNDKKDGRFKLSEINIPDVINEDIAWFLGFMVGDGNFHYDGIRFTLGIRDVDLIDRISEFIKSIGLMPHIKQYDTNILCEVWSRNFSQYIKTVLHDGKIDIPNIIFESPESVRASFLRGLFDSDGTISKKGAISYCSATPMLLKKVQALLLTLGIYSKFRHRENNHSGHNYLLIKTNDSKHMFMDKIGSFCAFKKDRMHKYPESKIYDYLNVNGLKYDKISLIELIDECDTYNFTMNGIHEYNSMGIISKNSGGGVGIDISTLREEGAVVRETNGVASGAVSFMEIYNTVANVTKQGGKRRAALMGVMRVDHPEILDFIRVKNDRSKLNNFNLSVAVTDKFMKAAENGENYDLISPKNGKVGELNAREVFQLIAQNAWENGEPGLLFIDTINHCNPIPQFGKISCTNPCGEIPLLENEACNLLSINLKKLNTLEEIETTVRLGVRFLNGVLDVSTFPTDSITKQVATTKKIGLGVMGWADYLAERMIPYDSKKARTEASELMANIKQLAHDESVKIANERNEYIETTMGKRRNGTLLCIAPTGTISMIADCSSSIEPYFALSYTKNVMDGQSLKYINDVLVRKLKEENLWCSEVKSQILKTGSIQHIDTIPDRIKCVFKTANEISIRGHIEMQAAFQKHVDNSISKTINLSSEATVNDVMLAYLDAYRLGVKGITIYRDGSRSGQVLTSPKARVEKCPECQSKSISHDSGCVTCQSCGWSICSI